GLERRQAFLGRIVDIGAELYAMSAACVKARADRGQEPRGVELADLFCRQGRLRGDALLDELWNNTDAVDVRAAKPVVAGRYEFLEEGVIAPPAAGEWVSTWEPAPSSTSDVRRRL